MNRFLKRLQPRELVLCEIVILLLIGVPVVHRQILPALDQWRSQRAQLVTRASEYAELTRNIAVQETVDREFDKLGPDAVQVESDQITLSVFLLRVETALSRRPSMTMINATPLPVEAGPDLKVYRVAVTVAGKLPEILQFLDDLATKAAPVGIESFALRGIQGHRMVECSLGLRKLHLLADDADDRAAPVGRIESN